MNELKIITNEFIPAKVDFNYREVETFLNEVLKKYDGLVFTEETVQDCNKTIAELRKGKMSLDNFRKKTKKELTKSVTEFENKCKELNKKFDEVINPLVEQSDFFEEQRRNEKRQKVQKIVDEVITEYGLNEKYANQLIIEDQYLNKTKTFKSIREELKATAEGLGIQQDKEEADKEIIKTKVELANAKYNLNLAVEPYIRLLEYENVEDISTKILMDVEKLTEEKEEPKHTPEPTPTPKPVEVTPTLEIGIDDEIYMERYEVEGTDKQLESLENFMDANGLEWKIID
jgi:hypothetical protein